MTDVDIRFYLTLLWRRLPYLALVVISITAAGIAVALLMPVVYRASAKILVEAPQIPSDLARTTVSTDPWQQVQIIQERLTTRENLVDFARRLNIYGPETTTLSEADIVDDMRKRVTFEPLEMTVPGQGTSMFAVSFDAADPDMAARVANQIVKVILDKNITLRTDRASDTMQFFQQETSRLGRELTSIEANILKFKNTHEEALPDSVDFRRTQQSNLQEQLVLLDREESALRARRNNVMRAFESTGRVASTGPTSPEQQTLDELNRTLAGQLVLFSEDSPTIVALRARIAALKGSIKAKQSADTSGPSDLDLQLSDIDTRLKAIADERRSINGNLADLARTIAATPANETELSALERNRQNIQAQYNIAVAKLAEASTGEQIEANSKGSRLSVVEPASPPTSPIKPKRTRIAGLSLLAGIAAALGLMVFLEFINNRIRRPKELADLLEMQPLATIPYIWTEEETRKRRAGFGWFAAMSALALPGQGSSPLAGLAGRVAGLFGQGRKI
ncbi:GumC family protein [Mesorhizobium sp. SP-1A]|uniref:GumC family protein n=1 Tax=Mesorhizobium sp. SP-1A TaxID=3077840 RepID=UPI0028F73A66|nr:Wzz/FepE/Etk N-terminal domain-containing protein [Mesorhizobium sp. SP-1A]